MIEQGIVTQIQKDTVEVEIPVHQNCHNCNACLTRVPDKRVITVLNNRSVRIGDKVSIFIRENKIRAGFLIYILPLLIFFLMIFLSDRILHIQNEWIIALIGFFGIGLTYMVIKIFSASMKIKNYIIDIKS